MDEFEADDRRRQAERFRPVRPAQGHGFIVMTTPGRHDLLWRTLVSLTFEKHNILVIEDAKREGQAKTFFRVLKRAAAFSRVTIMEDDIIVTRNFLDYVLATDVENFALVSWFNRGVPNPQPAYKPYWMIDRAAEFTCNQAITMPAATVHALLASPQLRDWKEPHGADVLIGQVMPDAPVAWHFPSLVDHTGGLHSLVGNAASGARTAATFPGEAFDASTLAAK